MVIPPGLIKQMADARAAAQEASAAVAGARQALGGTPHAKPPEKLGLATPLRVVIFLVINAAGVLWLISRLLTAPVAAAGGMVGALIVSIILVRVVHVAAQWERGVVLRVGKLQAVRGPGLVLIFPVIDHLMLIDTRTQTLAIAEQRLITRDNVPVSINGVLYYKVPDVTKAVTQVQDYEFAILQYAQATLRDVIGGLTLDELLAEREQIQKNIETVVEKQAATWGLEVEALRLQDLDMPEELKKMMSRQASAEREKRATITKAEGDKLAAVNLAEAAATMAKSPGAMQLRTLQTIDSLGPSPANTIVLAVPSEVFTLVKGLNDTLSSRPTQPGGSA